MAMWLVIFLNAREIVLCFATVLPPGINLLPQLPLFLDFFSFGPTSVPSSTPKSMSPLVCSLTCFEGPTHLREEGMAGRGFTAPWLYFVSGEGASGGRPACCESTRSPLSLNSVFASLHQKKVRESLQTVAIGFRWGLDCWKHLALTKVFLISCFSPLYPLLERNSPTVFHYWTGFRSFRESSFKRLENRFECFLWKLGSTRNAAWLQARLDHAPLSLFPKPRLVTWGTLMLVFLLNCFLLPFLFLDRDFEKVLSRVCRRVCLFHLCKFWDFPPRGYYCMCVIENRA